MKLRARLELPVVALINLIQNIIYFSFKDITISCIAPHSMAIVTRASSLRREVLAPDIDDGEMTDEKMQDMLAQAAERLRQNASMQLAQKEERPIYTLPRLDTGEVGRAYTTKKNGIAHMDASRGVREEDRKQAGQIRKVEDPVVVQRRAEEVSTGSLHTFCIAYEENLSQLILERSSGTVLVVFPHH